MSTKLLNINRLNGFHDLLNIQFSYLLLCMIKIINFKSLVLRVFFYLIILCLVFICFIHFCRGRNPGFARKEVIKNNILKKEAKKKMKKTLKNFYRFQIKENKINRKYFHFVYYVQWCVFTKILNLWFQS